MPALLINIKIDLREKFEIFKITLKDISGLFEECHIKIRGIYSQEGIKYTQSQLGNEVHLYQDLQESDWVASTLEMLSNVRSRSVFLYFEDHKLLGSRKHLERTIADFGKHKLDYLCYSFFKASQLHVKNLLPLGVTQREFFHEFALTAQNIALIGKISPGYYTFSLVSLISVIYFRDVLSAENKRYKIFSKIMASIIARLFPYPTYRAVFNKINHALSPLSVKLCLYPPSSPFDLEKIWFEAIPIDEGLKFGILKEELFVNYDDDNGAYEESLIKRGVYPFFANSLGRDSAESMNSVECQIALSDGECFDCTYYSHNGRIRRAPEVEIRVVRGRVTVLYQGTSVPLSSGEPRLFYSNLGPIIQCAKSAELTIRIFDEVF